MKRLWQKKWFGVGILTLAVLALLFLLFQQAGNNSIPGNEASQETIQGDNDAPTVAIERPEERSWQGRNFSLKVFEEDLDSALKEDSCTYQVCSYSSEGEERCSGIIQRTCNGVTPEVAVGQDAQCAFEGREACLVFAEAYDVAGNKGETHAVFHVDFTPPLMGEAVLEQHEGGYAVKGSIQDKSGIAKCSLYKDARYLKDMELEGNCKESCEIAATFRVEEVISSEFFARCTDLAGNSADGNKLLLRVNQMPEISSCRALPTQGALGTEFQFSANATDPDEDSLTYSWDFGDGTSGQGESVAHSYEKSGTYIPVVHVTDTQGKEAVCSTAWVLVEE